MSEEDKYDDEENEDSGEEDQQTGKYDKFGTYFGQGSQALSEFDNYFRKGNREADPKPNIYDSQALSEFDNYFRKGNREADPKPNIYERLLGTRSVLDEIRRGDSGASKGLELYLPVEDELPPGTFHSDEGTETDVERELSEVPQVEFRAEFDEYEPVDTSARLPNEIHGSGLTKEQARLLNELKFKLTGHIFGQGAYGIVFEVIDDAGHNYAVKIPDLTEKTKIRRKQRKWDLVDILKEEKLPADAGRNNLVQRLVLGDMVFMDVYKRTLETIIPNAPATLPGRTGKHKDPNVKTTHAIPLETAIRYSRDAVHALSYLHTKVSTKNKDGESIMGKIHRDIKPDNLLLDSEDNLFLTDLGLSTESDNEGLAEYSHGRIGKFITKPYELYRTGSTQSFQTDVWSMGAVIGKMLTGQYPLEDLLDEDDAREKIGKMTEEEADTRMETYVKQAHPAFREFLKSALAYDSEKRIQDGEELKRRFSQAAKDYRSKRPWNVIRKWAGRATTIVGSALLGSALTLGWQAYSEPVDTDRHERSKKLETKYNPKLETKSNDRFPREVR